MTDDHENHCSEAVEHARDAFEHAKAAVEHARQAEKLVHGDAKEAAARLVEQAEKRAELAGEALGKSIEARDECHKTEEQVKITRKAVEKSKEK
jgi:hypothetical protein